MNRKLTALAFLAITLIGPAQAKMPTEVDGLIEVKSKKMDAAYLLPGADFRSYDKIMVDPSVVAFQKNWLRDQNGSLPIGASDRRITASDAQKILSTAQQNFDEVFADTLTKAGYTLVTTPGPGVLRLSPSVVNLYIVAPEPSGPTMGVTFTVQPSEGTLVLEARDSQTNTLLATVLDQRQTQNSGGAQISSQASNINDFRQIVHFWAAASAAGLESLKTASPIPADLQPGQKL